MQKYLPLELCSEKTNIHSESAPEVFYLDLFGVSQSNFHRHVGSPKVVLEEGVGCSSEEERPSRRHSFEGAALPRRPPSRHGVAGVELLVQVFLETNR